MILAVHNLSLCKSFYTITSEDLEAYLKLFASRFRFVTFGEYLTQLREKGNPGNLVTLTFDDGFRSFAEYAIPVMERTGIPAVNFVASGHVGGCNAWDAHLTDEVFPVMNAAEIKAMSSHPLVTIGAHTVSHTSLGWLKPEMMKLELLESKTALEQITGREIEYFSYPYGQIQDMPSIARQLLQQNGYSAAVGSRYSAHNNRRNLYALNRVSLEPDDSPATIFSSIHGKSSILKQTLKDVLWRMRLRGKPGGLRPE